MEEQLAELAAKLVALESKAAVTNTVFAETYYYLSIPLMILIHAGFLAYEMGASRMKNVLSSGVKNISGLRVHGADVLLLWLVGLLGVPHRNSRCTGLL